MAGLAVPSSAPLGPCAEARRRHRLGADDRGAGRTGPAGERGQRDRRTAHQPAPARARCRPPSPDGQVSPDSLHVELHRRWPAPTGERGTAHAHASGVASWMVTAATTTQHSPTASAGSLRLGVERASSGSPVSGRCRPRSPGRRQERTRVRPTVNQAATATLADPVRRAHRSTGPPSPARVCPRSARGKNRADCRGRSPRDPGGTRCPASSSVWCSALVIGWLVTSGKGAELVDQARRRPLPASRGDRGDRPTPTASTTSPSARPPSSAPRPPAGSPPPRRPRSRLSVPAD